MSKLYSPDCSYSLRLLDKLKRIDIEKNTGLDFIMFMIYIILFIVYFKCIHAVLIIRT